MIRQLLVQEPAPTFPFGTARLNGLRILSQTLLQGFARLDGRHHPRAAIDDQEQQDERAHGAQQHREKWEGRDLQAVPPPPHAAAPGRGPTRAAADVAVRAVIR